MQQELDLYRLKGKDDATTFDTVNDPSLQERNDVSVHGLYIPANPSSRFSN